MSPWCSLISMGAVNEEGWWARVYNYHYMLGQQTNNVTWLLMRKHTTQGASWWWHIEIYATVCNHTFVHMNLEFLAWFLSFYLTIIKLPIFIFTTMAESRESQSTQTGEPEGSCERASNHRRKKILPFWWSVRSLSSRPESSGRSLAFVFPSVRKKGNARKTGQNVHSGCSVAVMRISQMKLKNPSKLLARSQ